MDPDHKAGLDAMWGWMAERWPQEVADFAAAHPNLRANQDRVSRPSAARLARRARHRDDFLAFHCASLADGTRNADVTRYVMAVTKFLNSDQDDRTPELSQEIAHLRDAIVASVALNQVTGFTQHGFDRSKSAEIRERFQNLMSDTGTVGMANRAKMILALTFEGMTPAEFNQAIAEINDVCLPQREKDLS